MGSVQRPDPPHADWSRRNVFLKERTLTPVNRVIGSLAKGFMCISLSNRTLRHQPDLACFLFSKSHRWGPSTKETLTYPG